MIAVESITTAPLHPDFTVEVCQPPQFSASLMARVDEIWRHEKATRGDRLVDGPIHSLASYEDDHVLLQPLNYRHFMARKNAPELASKGLNVRSVGVTGLLSCIQGLILGCRAKNVATDANLWEPAPAGGLSIPDPAAQLIEELGEELGLKGDQVTPPEACGLVFDAASGVVDILFKFHTTMELSDILECHRNHGTDEYQRLVCLSPQALPEFLVENETALLPTLKPMLRLSGWL